MLADLKYFRPIIDRVSSPGRLTRRVLFYWAYFNSTDVSHIPNGALSRQLEPVRYSECKLRGRLLRIHRIWTEVTVPCADGISRGC